MAILFVHEDRVRRYLVEVPIDWYLRSPLPLVIALHDVDQTADQARVLFNLHRNNLSEVPGELSKAVVVYPESERHGAGGAWNDGFTRQGRDFGPDDVGFLDTVLGQVLNDLQAAWTRERTLSPFARPRLVDPDRFFLVGIGNGAVMAQRWYLHSTRSPPFRGLALVQGTTGGARHGVYAEPYSPRILRWAPTAPVSAALGLLVLVNGRDTDWANTGPDALGLPDGRASAAEARLVYGADGQGHPNPDRLARWTLLPHTSVEAWTTALGLTPWTGDGDHDAEDYSSGHSLRLRFDADREHGWTSEDTTQVLEFFATLT